MDRIDFEILAALQNNARLSNKELAALVELSPSTCLERTRRLRESGALRDFRAVLDEHAIGIGLQALIAIRLQRHQRADVEAFRSYILGLPEVVEFFHVAGEFDYQVHVVVRDADHLRDLAMDYFTTQSLVSHMETHLIFEVRRKGLPLYAAERRSGGSD